MTTSAQSTQQLVEQCQGMVRSLAIGIHRKLPPHVELDDVIAYGQVGLAEAARDFDPSRGSRFSTYAYYRVRGAIYDGLSKMAWFSRSQYQHVRYERMAGEVLHGANAPEETPHEEENLENDMRWMRDLGRALAIVYLTTHSEAKEETKEISIADSARFAPPRASHESRDRRANPRVGRHAAPRRGGTDPRRLFRGGHLARSWPEIGNWQVLGHSTTRQGPAKIGPGAKALGRGFVALGGL